MKIVLLLLTCFSCGVLAITQQTQIDLMLNLLAKTGQLQQQADCTGLSEQRLRELYRNTMQHCGLDGEDTAHESCVKQRLLASGVPAERWQQCEQTDDDPQSAIMAQLDALYERIGDRAPTAEEQTQLEQLLVQMQQQGIVQLQQMMNHMAAASVGTEAAITLPIMPGSKILMHIPGSIDLEIDDKMISTLPGASFASTKTPEQVLAYYQQQLPSFKLHSFSLGEDIEHALLERLQPGFYYPREMLNGIRIPHIHIQPANSMAEQLLPGAKTLFFIYYKPAS